MFFSLFFTFSYIANFRKRQIKKHISTLIPYVSKKKLDKRMVIIKIIIVITVIIDWISRKTGTK